MLPMRPMKLGGEYIIFGENSLEYLTQLNGRKAFIVLGIPSMKENGQLKEIEDLLHDGDMETALFDGVEPDPSITTVQKGAKAMLEFGPDWIVAVGGGSAMDAAKAMWIIYEHPELQKIEELKSPIPKLREKAKMVCIPTSSGTGSEVSRSIVITDPETHVKYGIGDMEMMPDIALLEPKLTVSLPKGITAATGMDALTHAIEARVSNRANTLADILADYAIKNITKNIYTAYSEPTNIQARENMLVSSMVAGMAFTNVSLGITHSLAHAIGGKFGVPHGIANAIILPYVIQFNEKDETANRIYRDIESHLGVQSLVGLILELNTKMDIPENLQSLISDASAYEALVPELAALAKADGCTKTNPIIPTIEEFEMLFKRIYKGSVTTCN